MAQHPILVPPGPVNLSPGSSVDYEPRTNELPFGDGYTQRSGDGINSLQEKVSVNFSAVTDAEFAQLAAFFRERGGRKPFWFALPGESVKQWTAPKWGRTYRDRDINDMTATLLQNFDP